ncbi:MAG: hypothetical protein F6K34_04960, partial [Okeania sp. SIO4D6]|nr:hypothetical protein [Okeania sp. SIO4D6]
ESILDETTAINTALDRASSGGLVVILPESVSRAISLIEVRNPVQDLELPESSRTSSNSSEELNTSIVY